MSGRKHVFLGKAACIVHDSEQCQNSLECSKRLGKVFDRSRKPWIDPDKAPVGDIREAVEACPNGALELQVLESKKDNIGRLNSEGPVSLSGNFVIVTEDGARRTTQFTELCRCGASQTKPYCDGSHVEEEFLDIQGMREVSHDTVGSSRGTVVIKCMPNGPLSYTGAITFENNRGQSCSKRNGSLCRCGKSSNKPFCDGTHLRVNFKTIAES